jgi:oxygen-independent coproporphyrinogen-3 oxidase
LYLLELYPNAPLREDMAREGWQLAPDDLAAEMYLRGLALLETAGYVHYEISNVARDGRFAWHNVKYWTDGEWLGIGCGAHGTRQGERWRNVAGTREYVDRITGMGGDARAETRRLSREDAFREALMMGMRLTGGVDVPAMHARYQEDAWQRFGPALERFCDAGLVTFRDVRLRLTRHGMLLANEVLAVFV